MIKRWLTKLGTFLVRDELREWEYISNKRMNKIVDMRHERDELINKCNSLEKDRAYLAAEMVKMRSNVNPWEASRHHAAKQSYREHVDALRREVFKLWREFRPDGVPLYQRLCLEDYQLEQWMVQNGFDLACLKES